MRSIVQIYLSALEFKGDIMIIDLSREIHLLLDHSWEVREQGQLGAAFVRVVGCIATRHFSR